jgi:two-component system chemotaxis response regulator CheB
MRVLIVDDSVVFRSQIKQSLSGIEGLEVVGTAANGKIALERLQEIPCEVVILDLEMPEMNGFEFLAELRARRLPQKVIVFAANDQSGANNVFEAFRAGAVDFITKPKGASNLDASLASIREQLVPKIVQFRERQTRGVEPPRTTPARPVTGPAPAPAHHPAQASAYPRVSIESFHPRVVLIGSSTGGPGALDQLFAAIKGLHVSVPILIAQHMPPLFTESLARRLSTLSGIPAAEAKSGETVQPGRIYVAPGDFHMSVAQSASGSGGVVIRTDQAPKRHNVRPSVDTLFESAATVYGAAVAAFVLTGMGEDGRLGSVAIKQKSGAVMIQDRESSVVWGMPGAVHASGAYDREGSIVECAGVLAKLVG